MQAHFSADPRQGFGQEMSSPHPGFERSKGMLNRLLTDTHHLGSLIQATLHRIQYRFVLPTLNPSLRAGRATLFERTALAIRTPVAIHL